MTDKYCLVRFMKNQFSEDKELSDKEYSYHTMELNLKRGDYVVVQTKYGIGIGVFEKYTSSKENISRATSWVVEKVDLDEFEKKLATYEKKQALIEQMRQVYESSAELEIFKQLSQSSPIMKDLYEQFINL